MPGSAPPPDRSPGGGPSRSRQRCRLSGREALLSAGISVPGFDSGVYLLHTPGEDFPRREIDPHDPVVAVFPVQPAALFRLVAVLEPVESHAARERRQGLDITGEPVGPVLLRAYRPCRALRV